MHDCKPRLLNSDFPAINRRAVQVLQVNLGYRCNLSCVHCHVNAGPNRREQMQPETLQHVIRILRSGQIETLDLTGGAPEMHDDFRQLVALARSLDIEVIDRCNLTILLEDDYADLADFLAQHQARIVASLPCYLQENVDRQRGKGVFDASIAALQRLNALGYGHTPELKLDLVFNPQGASLPPEQTQLQQAYKQHLREHYGIVFNHLLAIANMPIQRFGSTLISQGGFDAYLDLLRRHHRSENIEQLMCRNTLSVDWQGYLYDCDFNQMLDLPLAGGKPTHIGQLELEPMSGMPIAIAAHCYGCTAGQGSSCGGALDAIS